MNNGYDPNQQAPQQPQYQQPLYEQKPALDAGSFFVLAIVGLALSFNVTIAGIIVSAIALSKAKAYFAAGGAYEGKAKVAKILATAGLWAGVGFTVFYFICFIIGVIIGLSGAASAFDYYDGYYTYY